MRYTRIATYRLTTRLHFVRGVEVMLDVDVARLLELDLAELTDCIAREPDVFPPDFVFPLNRSEVAGLRLGRDDGFHAPVLAFTEHAIAFILTQFDSAARAATVIEILRGFTLYRQMLASSC